MNKETFDIQINRNNDKFEIAFDFSKNENIKNTIITNLGEDANPLEIADTLFNGNLLNEIANLNFELGYLGNVPCGMLDWLDSNGNQLTSAIFEENITIKGLSNDDCQSSSDESDDLSNFTLDEEHDSQLSADDLHGVPHTVRSTSVVEVSNFVFDEVAFKSFVVELMDTTHQDLSKKALKKKKIELLKDLVGSSLANESDYNTKSNKKSLGYLLKSPKAIKLTVVDAISASYT